MKLIKLSQGFWAKRLFLGLVVAIEIFHGVQAHAMAEKDEGLLGEVRYSILDEPTFQKLYGVEGILMDGRNISGTDLHRLVNVTSIPDARGVFLRGKNNGRGDGAQNPDGDLAIGTLQWDQNQSHNHYNGTHQS